ncbi:MAG: hypothetical protein R3F30_13175 [Planctomycetota bacterium]
MAAAVDRRRHDVWFRPHLGPSWAIEGLGVDPRRFMRDGEVHVFVASELGGGYLDSLRARLGKAFGVADDGLTLVGVLDGGVKARLALGPLGGTSCAVRLIASHDDGLPVLSSTQVSSLTLVPALGLPTPSTLEGLDRRKALLPEAARARHSISGDRMRSLHEAVEAVVGGS